MTDAVSPLTNALMWALPLVVAVILHELAHAGVAVALGDETPRRAGRLSLNPLAHIDVMGTIVLPVMLLLASSPFLFGWAKPVPVAPRHFASPRFGMAAVALAGPAMNLLLALTALIVLRFVHPQLGGHWLTTILARAAFLNVLLAVFNLLPIPPLDGGRVLLALAPSSWARGLRSYERWGGVIFLGVILISVFGRAWLPVDFLDLIVGRPTRAILGALAAFVGL